MNIEHGTRNDEVKRAVPARSDSSGSSAASPRIIYLDHAAGSPPDADTIALRSRIEAEFSYNQESIHGAGRKVKKALEEKASLLRRLVTGSGGGGLLWGSCGSDVINSALSLNITGGASGKIISSAAEHPAVTHALKRHAEKFPGIQIIEAPSGHLGPLDLDALSKLADASVKAVFTHHVHNETGAVQDLAALRKLMDSRCPGALLLCDTVQSFCKIPIPWEDARIDFAFVSGSKIGGPRAGACVFRNAALSEKYTALRKNESAYCRPDPVSCITMTGRAENLFGDLERRRERAAALSSALRLGLTCPEWKNNEKTTLTVPAENTSPFITHLTVGGCQGAVLLRMLSERGIMVSSGSACGAESKTPSRALTAMGMSRDKAFSALRISLWLGTTDDDILQCLEALKEAVDSY
jgi:cysteine desulfurase